MSTSMIVSYLLFVAGVPNGPSVAQAPTGDPIKARLAAVEPAKYDADVVVVLDETLVTVRPNGLGVAESHRLARILRDGAIRSEAVQRFGYDPTTNVLDLRLVRVHRADGRVEDVDVHSAADQPDPQWGIFWGSRQLLVSVPHLEIGDAVETRIIKTGFNVAYLGEDDGGGSIGGKGAAGAAGKADAAESLKPPMPGHWYDSVDFYSSLPIIEKRYVVRLPRDKPLQYEVYNGSVRSSVLFEGDEAVYTFEKRDIPVYHGEPSAVSARDTECKLVLATLSDWPAKSRWFYEKNEPSFIVNDAIKAKVAEVVAPCKTDEEKITALNHWVAENIRYIGTSRGACEGYTTHSVVETFRDRGGVCKDKAGMLVAMLRQAGLDAFIVMTEAGADVAPVPADQFNHAVSCIRKGDGSFRLLDPTWMPKSRENWSSAEQLQYVVYGTPRGEPLARSPYSGPEDNAATWSAESHLADDGTLTGHLRFTAVGAPETGLRRAMARCRPEEREGLFTASFARLSPATLLSGSRAMDPVDFSGSMVVDADYSASNFVLGAGSRRYVPLPIMRTVLGDLILTDVQDAATQDKRTQPLRIRSTRRLRLEETLTLPAGWIATEMPDAKSIDGAAASLAFQVDKAAGSLHYRCDVDIKARTTPPESYANLKQVLDALRDLSRQLVGLQMETGSART